MEYRDITKYSITSRSEFSRIAIPTEPEEQTTELNIVSARLLQGNKLTVIADINHR